MFSVEYLFPKGRADVVTSKAKLVGKMTRSQTNVGCLFLRNEYQGGSDDDDTTDKQLGNKNCAAVCMLVGQFVSREKGMREEGRKKKQIFAIVAFVTKHPTRNFELVVIASTFSATLNTGKLTARATSVLAVSSSHPVMNSVNLSTAYYLTPIMP